MPHSSHSFKIPTAFLIFILLLIPFLLFAKTQHFGFLNWDDNVYISENTSIRGLDWEHAKQWLTKPYGKLYLPLPMLSYALEYHFYGLTPSIYHQTNLVFHLLNVWLVFGLFLFFFKDSLLAAIGALIFAVHPVQIDTVAWVTERKNLFLAFFLLSGMNLLVRAETSEKKWPSSIFFLFLLGFFSKITAVITPLLTSLHDYFYHSKKMTWKRLLFHGFFFAAALFLGLVTLRLYPDHFKASEQMPFFHFLAGQFRSFFLYLRLIFFPFELTLSYPVYEGWIASRMGTLMSVASVGLLWTCFFRGALKKKDWAFWLGWFLFSLLPVTSFLPIVTMHQQLYLPLIGIIGCGLVFAQRFKKIAFSILIFITLLLSVVTWMRLGIWENTEKFWSDVLTKSPNHYLALMQSGNDQFDRGNYLHAEELFKRSIAAAPSSETFTYLNLTNLYLHTGQIEKADELIQQLEAKNPSHPILPTLKVGNLFAKHNFDQTISVGENFIARGSQEPAIHHYIGLSYLEKNQIEKAYEHFQNAFLLGDTSSQNVFRMGLALSGMKEWQKAIQVWTPLAHEKPPLAGIYFHLGYAYLKLGQRDKAISFYERSTRIHPQISEAFYHLGLMAIEEKRLSDAVSFFKSALSIKPDSDLYRNRLQVTLEELKK